MTGNKEMSKWMGGGGGMQVSCTLHLKGSKRYRLIFEKKKQESSINIHGWTLNVNWSDIKVKTKN